MDNKFYSIQLIPGRNAAAGERSGPGTAARRGNGVTPARVPGDRGDSPAFPSTRPAPSLPPSQRRRPPLCPYSSQALSEALPHSGTFLFFLTFLQSLCASGTVSETLMALPAWPGLHSYCENNTSRMQFVLFPAAPHSALLQEKQNYPLLYFLTLTRLPHPPCNR